MNSTRIRMPLVALSIGAALASTPAFAQGYSPGRPMNDGGFQATQQQPALGQPNQFGDFYANQTGPQSSGVSNCAARFHSFDPATGTYLGFDGRHHSCQ